MRRIVSWLTSIGPTILATIIATGGGWPLNVAAAQEGKLPFQEAARVTLELDRSEYVLGENILVHYCLENTGEAPFHIRMGGDYRGASRSLRFKVTATDEDSKPVEDPDPSGFHMGGISWSPEIKPGEKYCVSLPLTRYCRFGKPGVYIIRVCHDLGWQAAGEHKALVGENRIKLTMPTPDQAKQVVDEMYKLPKDPSASAGQESKPYADFSCLWYPVYLPILLGHAPTGDDKALTAIGCMPTVQATQALISLLDSEDREFVLKVAGTLNLRLPDPEFGGMIGPRSPFRSPLDTRRRWLGANSWQPHFRPQVLGHARDMLSWDSPDAQAYAAFMMQSLGSKDDLRYLVKALDRVIPETLNSLRKENSYPEPGGVCIELRRVTEVLVKRGAEVPTNPQSPGEAVVFLTALKVLDGFRPEGWQATTAALLRHDIPYIRQLGLQSIPMPPSKPFTGLLPTLLADPDLVVRIQACNVAGQAGDPELCKSILENVSSARDEWLLRAAYAAAVATGARVEAAEALISRFDDTSIGRECFSLVMSAVIRNHGHGGSSRLDSQAAARLRARWMQFLQEHREAIGAGGRFEPGDPALTPDLMPPEYKIYLQDGKQWP